MDNESNQFADGSEQQLTPSLQAILDHEIRLCGQEHERFLETRNMPDDGSMTLGPRR